jgi:hypothetical protein
MVQIAMASNRPARLNNPSQQQPMAELAAKSGVRALLELLDNTVDAIRMSETPLDDTLLIEDILIRWSKTAIN